MKRFLLIIALITISLASCSKDNSGTPDKESINVNSQVKISGVPTGTKADTGTPILGTQITDSVEFAVKYMDHINFTALDAYGTKWQSTSFGYRKETYDLHRDTINNKLIYQGYQIIDFDGNLGYFINDCKDAVLVTYLDRKGAAIHPLKFDGHPDIFFDLDTIGYIPNAVTTRARREVTAAFNKEDYEECYRLFDELFVFVPTTGAKWRAMKAAGIE